MDGPTTMPPASSSPSERQVLDIRCDADAAGAPFWARNLAASYGFDRRGQWEVAMVVGEAASNIVKYGRRGSVSLRLVASDGCLEIEALDEGEGIGDIAFAQQDGVSEGTRRSGVADLRKVRGLGFGLGTIRRLTDDLVILRRPTGGTQLLAHKRR